MILPIYLFFGIIFTLITLYLILKILGGSLVMIVDLFISVISLLVPIILLIIGIAWGCLGCVKYLKYLLLKRKKKK